MALSGLCVPTSLLLAMCDRRGLPPGPGPAPAVTDYVVGPQDVLTITPYDQADLSGKFAVEADGTFTYPLIGRLTAGGLSLRGVETQLKKRLKDEGFFNDPQVTVSVETYKSQKIFVVGEVRIPGSYPLSGDMTLVEALARAGSTLPTASGEVVIVRAAAGRASGPLLPTRTSAADIVRVDLKDLQNGALAQNAALRDGDTIFVPRAESVYVFGQVKNPGAYAVQQKNTSVMQALSLAGGLTDRGSTAASRSCASSRARSRRSSVKLGDSVSPATPSSCGRGFSDVRPTAARPDRRSIARCPASGAAGSTEAHGRRRRDGRTPSRRPAGEPAARRAAPATATAATCSAIRTSTCSTTSGWSTSAAGRRSRRSWSSSCP